jgi:serine protease Do
MVTISSAAVGLAPTSGSQQPSFSEPFARSMLRGPYNSPRRGRNTGAGILVSTDGYVLTTYHVIEGAEDIQVTLADRRKLRPQIVGTDPLTDLAVLKLPGTGFPTLPLGDSSQVAVAEPVVAIGNPFGLSHTVTMGIVSALSRANVGITDYEDYIQTDAAINPGNSGGALINACGELIGINTALFSTSGTYMGVGFAVPVNLARTILEQIRQHGRVSRGWLGLVVQELTPALARGLGKPEMAGLLVSDVSADSPAAHAGLQRDDVLLHYHNTPADDVGRFRNLVAQSTPGSRLGLTVHRDGKEHRIEVTVGERTHPALLEDSGATESTVLGMELVNLDLALTRRLGLPLSAQGAVVIEVLPGSVSEGAGLQSGDVIYEVNRQPVRSVSDFGRLVEQGRKQPLLLFVNREGSTIYLVLELRG